MRMLRIATSIQCSRLSIWRARYLWWVFGENEVSRFVYGILTGRVLTTVEQDHEHGGGLNANGARQGVAMSYNQLYPDDDEYNATNTGPVLTFQRTSARLRFIRRIAETDSTGGLLSRTKTIFHMQRAKYVILCFREFTANDIVLLCTVLLTYAFTLNLTQVFMVIGTYNKRKTKRHLLDEDNIQVFQIASLSTSFAIETNAPLPWQATSQLGLRQFSIQRCT